MISPVNSPGSPGMPQGLMLPDIIITRRTRTISMNGRIEEDVHEGTVRFFCRSKGHGFIDDDIATATAEAKVCSWNCFLYALKKGILNQLEKEQVLIYSIFVCRIILQMGILLQSMYQSLSLCTFLI